MGVIKDIVEGQMGQRSMIDLNVRLEVVEFENGKEESIRGFFHVHLVSLGS
jgi:hypothetical protein